MIYRILIQDDRGLMNVGDETERWVDVVERKTIMDLFRDDECFELGFYGPRKNKHFSRKARFYFTELGYDTFGRRLRDIAQHRGYPVKVIKRKNPKASDVAYKDKYQVAVLPKRKR